MSLTSANFVAAPARFRAKGSGPRVFGLRNLVV